MMGLNVVMTVIGFGVSVMFIVFVCTRLICKRIHLRQHSSPFPLPNPSNHQLTILERGLYGLESVVIAKFPTKKFNIALFASSEDAKCTVCLEDYLEDDKLRILTNCGHSFHVVCIDQWLQQHSTCPICRISLRQFPENRRMPPMFSAAVRSQYAIGSFESRASIDRRMQPIHSGRFESDNDGVEDVENTPNLNENKEVEKISVSKHVESPSYT